MRRIVIPLILTFIFLNVNVNSQVILNRVLTIADGIADGSIQYTLNFNMDEEDFLKLFDGNPYTGGGNTAGDTTIITFEFDNPPQLHAAATYFWANGVWSLTGADNEADLNSQSGSFVEFFSGRSYSTFSWDSTDVSGDAKKWLRLTCVDNSGSGTQLGEIRLYAEKVFTALSIKPALAKLIPNTSLQLFVKLVDEHGKQFDYDLPDQIVWSSQNASVLSVDELGKVTAHTTGTAGINAVAAGLTGVSYIDVVEDFASEPADTMFLKVAVVIEDPIIDFNTMERISQKWNWTDPHTYIDQIVQDFKNITDGVVQYEIAEMHDGQMVFTMLDSVLMSVDTLAYFFQNSTTLYGELKNLAEQQGRVKYNYVAMVDYYDLDTKRNNGDIDEVWVYTFPFGGMYESQLMGPGAFWWNSPPLDHPGLEKILSVMGWNYERGLAEALHSYGHRFESAMVNAYGRWNYQAEDPNNWELFTRIQRENPNASHCGNVHFPPNGNSDYDYGNSSQVITYADNWKRYPILLDQQRTITCSEWGCSQLGFMRWWFRHMPRYKGVTDGILNNWWHYAIDYYEAVDLANYLTGFDPETGSIDGVPESYQLYQNFPNPFNPETTIRFEIPEKERISLKVYDILGRLVTTLADEVLPAGKHEYRFNATDLASGIYIYRLSTESFTANKKALFLK